jgi:glycosyltransferase 2 family protein
VKIRTLVVTCVSLGLLWWFLRHANLADVWEQVRRADKPFLVVGLMFVAATYWARAVRWHHMLTPIGPTRFRSTFRATVIGFAALGVLPARAGDVLRPYLLARQEGLSVTATMATIVMERVLDLVAVLLLLAIYVFGFADSDTMSTRALRSIEVSAAVAAAVAAVLLVLLWTLAAHPERIGTLTLSATRVLPAAIGKRLAYIASRFSSGLVVTRRPRQFVLAAAWSLPIWIFGAAEIWAVTRAFGMTLPFPGSFLIQALLVIGVAVPTPGGVGSFHEAYRFGMTSFFAAPNAAAVAAAIVVHALSFGPVILVGLLFMAQDGLTIGRLRSLADSDSARGAVTNP